MVSLYLCSSHSESSGNRLTLMQLRIYRGTHGACAMFLAMCAHKELEQWPFLPASLHKVIGERNVVSQGEP